MFCVFPYSSLIMRIQFSRVIGFVWVSISRKIEECGICKKPKPLKCLCFPIFFPYWVNSLFQCFETWELYGFLLLAKYVRKTNVTESF